VRRDQQVFKIPKRRISGQRLLFKYVQRSAADLMITESSGEGGLIDKRTTTDVN